MNDDAPYDDAPQQCPQYTTEKKMKESVNLFKKENNKKSD
jgi:hypothetical protein